MRQRTLVAAIGAGALLAAILVEVPYRLTYNMTSSVPIGWYWRSPIHAPRKHDLVFVILPRPIASFAEHREYIGPDVPLLKYVAAVSGDHVCLHGATVIINGKPRANAQPHDGAGHALIPWPGCRNLEPDEFFLLNPDSPLSFDSRYFGPVIRDSIIGKATPLATEETNAWQDPNWLHRVVKSRQDEEE